jgi:release factor glutamine methyltransferase
MMNFALEANSTPSSARRALVRAFRAHGLETPELDARVLTAHALGIDDTALAADSARSLGAEEVRRIAAYGVRRLEHEPVARIIGRKEFWSLTFAVTDAVLVPRPETETLVETALAAVDADRGRKAPLRILDIGTGSGALLLALLSELPNASGVGTDRDPAAAMVAQDNARRLGFARRSKYVACNYADAVAGRFDLLLSNPPYVATKDWSKLAPEVRDYDPRLALDGGADGLRCYRAIISDAHRLLSPHAHLIVEIGAGQCSAVSGLLATAGFSLRASARPDLAGIPRALSARKNP